MKKKFLFLGLMIVLMVIAALYVTHASPLKIAGAAAVLPVFGMAALAQDRDTPSRDGELYSLGVAANAKIFAGSIVCLNSSGYAVPGSDTAGLKAWGRAEENVDNTGGANGAKTVLVREGVFKFAATGLTVADVGKPCFLSDDQTVSVAATANNVFAGIIEAIDSATEPWVEIDPSKRAAAAQADSAAADVATLKADFNALLAKLRAGRVIAS